MYEGRKGNIARKYEGTKINGTNVQRLEGTKVESYEGTKVEM